MALLSVYGAVKEVEGFTQRKVDYLIEHVKGKIADFLGNRQIQAKGKVEELRAIEAKIDGLEEKNG